MDKKGKVSDVVYPNIMFYVDNFEDVRRNKRIFNMTLCVCVCECNVCFVVRTRIIIIGVENQGA